MTEPTVAAEAFELAFGDIPFDQVLALREGTDASLTHRILRLTQLAPDVIETLLTSPKLGAEPVLSRRWPQDWCAQRALLAEIGAAR